jgi:hypothetical protein
MERSEERPEDGGSRGPHFGGGPPPTSSFGGPPPSRFESPGRGGGRGGFEPVRFESGPPPRFDSPGQQQQPRFEFGGMRLERPPFGGRGTPRGGGMPPWRGGRGGDFGGPPRPDFGMRGGGGGPPDFRGRGGRGGGPRGGAFGGPGIRKSSFITNYSEIKVVRIRKYKNICY